MRNRLSNTPLIVIGAHRSGTTLVVDILKNLGFFAGHIVDENQESTFFLTRNEWLMRRVGGSWDNPLPAKIAFSYDFLRHDAIDVMRKSLSSFHFYEFTGFFNKPKPDRPWGWKDPRNIFTFSIWSYLFPCAKLLYINRNGVDSSNSLFQREKKLSKRSFHNTFSISSKFSRFSSFFRPFEHFVLRSARCLSLIECFHLWEEYTFEAENLFSSYSGSKHRILFENLLSNPLSEIHKLASFSGVQYSDADLLSSASIINPSRSFAFIDDKSLRHFYEEVRHSVAMKLLGYDSII